MNHQQEKIDAVISEVEKVIIGKRSCIELILCAVLAEGHILIEDIPGVGKTTLAQAFSRSMNLVQHRMQFTSDIMPSDVTGFTVYRRESESFEYQQGAVMCNFFLADEINRTSPKTQSALLEVMEEHAVTVDGITRPVPRPFIVMATENPVGYTGTQMLPESQLDRFSISVVIGYPDAADEVKMLKNRAFEQPLDHVRSVISSSDLLQMQEEVRQVMISDAVYQYIVELAACTRHDPEISLGLSPRGSLSLAALSRAHAYRNGRSYVQPEDVYQMFGPVVRHRLILSSEAKLNHHHPDEIVADILKRVKKPLPERLAF